jgi:nucleotide-binding universal stress UspA family protein
MEQQAQAAFSQQPIVVGVDGSASSKAALRWAARQAQLTGTSLSIISTWDYPTGYGWAMAWPEEVDFEADTRKALDEVILSELGDNSDRDITVQVIEGHPALQLEQASGHASLIVVGCRGHGEFAGMLIGSVSGFLSTHAHCPVVVIRGETHNDTDEEN